MGTAPGGSTLPGGSTWGPAAGSRQKNIQARGRAGGPTCDGPESSRGLPPGATGLRGWGRPGRAFNLNLREASRRRAAPGRAGIWAPAAPPVVQSRRRRQLLRPGARLLSYVCSGREVSGDAWRARLGVFSDQPHGDLSGGLARISPGRRAVDCLRGLSREQAPSHIGLATLRH